MSGNYLLACIVLLALGSSHGASVMEGNFNVTAYCSIQKIGIQISSIQSCSTYYVCSINGPVQNNCATGYSFDKNSQSCKPSSQVNCYYGVANPCAGKNDNTFVPNVDVCGGWILCKGGVESYRGQCSANEIFSNGACIYGDCTATGSDQSSITSACDVVPNDVFFGSTLNCSEWQKCSTNGLQTGNCGAGMVYNAPIGFCDYQSSTSCSWVTDTPINADPGPCKNAGELTADINTCSNYYQCDGSNFILKSCNYGYYYDVKNKNCQPRKIAVPVASCDRCQFTTAQFVNSVGTNCQGYEVCKNSVKVGVGSCLGDTFFNEAFQGCVDYSTLNTYANNNGACYGATAPTSAPPTDTTEESTANPSAETTANPSTTSEPDSSPVPTSDK